MNSFHNLFPPDSRDVVNEVRGGEMSCYHDPACQPGPRSFEGMKPPDAH